MHDGLLAAMQVAPTEAQFQRQFMALKALQWVLGYESKEDFTALLFNAPEERVEPRERSQSKAAKGGK